MTSIKILGTKLGTEGASLSEFDVSEPLGYTHTLTSDGMFESASFSAAIKEVDVNGWMERVLGSHVECISPSGDIIWIGFINQIDLALGRASISIGPVTDIANKVRVRYTEQDYTVLGVTFGGTEEVTDYTTDSDSVARYGSWARDISGGEINTNSGYADDLRDIALVEYAWPARTNGFSLSGNELSVSVSCVGYHKLLDAYQYRYTTPGTVNPDDVITSVLAASDNSVISGMSLAYVDTTNSISIEKTDEDAIAASTFIRDVVNLGDSSNDRWLFYISEVNGDIVPVYKQAPDVVYYEASVRSDTPVKLFNGADIDPWYVRPGRWIYYTDISDKPPTSFSGYANLNGEPGMTFIESVTYTAPYGLTINGGKLTRLDQQLARIGLASDS